MNLRQLSLAVLLVLVTALQFHAAEQYSARIFRSVNRSPGFHPSQAAVFQFDVLRARGGVLSQTSHLLTATGERAPFSVALDLDSGEYPGYVLVRHADTTVPYPIEYSDLVPMALFVDSDATSLYTLWDDADDRLPQDFLRQAGFVEHRIRGLVALEFHDTQYSDALYFLDLCLGCRGEQELVVGDDLTQALRESSGAAEDSSSYINTDVGLPFIFSADSGWADLNGRIGRFQWEVSSSGVSISAFPVLPTPAWELADAWHVLTAFLLLAEDATPQVTALDFATSTTASSQFALNGGFFLFETLALLRAAKSDDPAQWSEFMQLLSSETLVIADPEPWDRYTRSLCMVYPEERECLG